VFVLASVDADCEIPFYVCRFHGSKVAKFWHSQSYF